MSAGRPTNAARAGQPVWCVLVPCEIRGSGEQAGRAAKRLGELTGRTATTIHRLIRGPREEDADSPVTLFDHQDPLEDDLIVIDEASVLDLSLFDRLPEKVRPGTHLLLVGDTHQLPSVGPGKVLHDLLQVQAIPRVALTEIFRQGKDSAITLNAHRINAGQTPHSAGDFWFIPVRAWK